MYHNSILSYYTEAKQIQSGSMPIPRMVLFSMSSKCNANCPYCIYKAENKKGNVIAENMAIDIIEQLAEYGVKAIDLCGGGDPLTVPYFAKIAKLINKRGMKFGVITNGINLKGDILKAIIDYGSYLRVSYDSSNKEIYKLMKGVDQSEQVLNNLITACKYREESKSKCEVSVKIGLSKDNIELPGLINTILHLKKLPLNRITVRLLRNNEKELTDMSALENVQNNIMMFDSQDNNAIVNVNFNKTELKGECWLNPIHSVITDTGEVYICCYYVGREKEHSIGNMHHNTFAGIWESAEHYNKLEGIDTKYCQIYDCKFHAYNAIMTDAIDNGTLEFC